MSKHTRMLFFNLDKNKYNNLLKRKMWYRIGILSWSLFVTLHDNESSGSSSKKTIISVQFVRQGFSFSIQFWRLNVVCFCIFLNFWIGFSRLKRRCCGRKGVIRTWIMCELFAVFLNPGCRYYSRTSVNYLSWEWDHVSQWDYLYE